MIIEGSANGDIPLTTKLIFEIEKEFIENLIHGGYPKRVRFRQDPVEERHIVSVERAMTVECTPADISHEISSYIHDVVSDNRETSNWSYIEYNGKSNPMTMVSGGITYKYEEIPIRVTVYNR